MAENKAKQNEGSVSAFLGISEEGLRAKDIG